MKKILLVKTSSLGDVVHNFPVVSDIRRRFPQACVDWVVEEAYSPLVALHPGVRRAIPVAIRRWRTHLLGAATWRETGALRRRLNIDRYDEVIDTQGLLKSALIVAATTGRRHGFDASSAREPLAARFYDTLHRVPRAEHAVARNRELVAASLGYRVDAPVDYGLRVDRGAGSPDTVVLLHSASRADKLWPESAWIELGRRLEEERMNMVLPWGSEPERERSCRIAGSLQRASVPEPLSLRAVVELLSRARAAVGVDTGLAHLAAAMSIPVVGIYCATDPRLTGIYGCPRAINLGGIGSPPSTAEVFEAVLARGAL